MNKNTSIYVDNYKIFDFDTSSSEKRYRIVSETCDVEINENVNKVLEFIKLNEGQTFSTIIKKCLSFFNNKENLEKTIDLLMEKGLLTGEKVQYKDIKEENYHRNKMEHLWFKIRFIDTEKYENVFKFFSFVFSKSFVFTTLSLFFLFDISFIGLYFFSPWGAQLAYHSSLDYFWLFIVYSFFALWLHETGHICAAKKYNAKTGGMGMGIYFYFPVGYADVHETWNLPRNQRKIVSIAGFYWNIISILPLYILCFYLNSKAIADFILLFHFAFISIFNPFLKMDGYWYFCDTLGVPNLKNRMNIYLFQYLPSKIFKKNKITNPFNSYPLKVQKSINIYLIIFGFFMYFFLSLFLSRVLNIALNIESEIFSPAKLALSNGGSEFLNKLIRNGFILFGGTMILISYGKKLIVFLIKKVRLNYGGNVDERE